MDTSQKKLKTRACPLTLGAQTSMLKATWEKLCAASKEGAENGAARYYRPVCLDCNGEVPAEVTFIALPENTRREDDGMGYNKTVTGTCKYCQELKIVRVVGNDNICAMCINMLCNIRKRPDSVLAAIKEVAPELLQSGADMVSADQLSPRQKEHLDKCETALIAIGAALEADNDEDLVDAAKRRMDAMAILDEKYRELSIALSKAEKERDYLRTQRDDSPTDAMRIAALESDLDAAMSLVNEANHLHASSRASLQDLALRLAVCCLKKDIGGIGVDDIELLRSC